ncbi:MAG: N-acetylmuramoyl-L-alanine amidase [Sphingomonas sp.]
MNIRWRHGRDRRAARLALAAATLAIAAPVVAADVVGVETVNGRLALRYDLPDARIGRPGPALLPVAAPGNRAGARASVPQVIDARGRNRPLVVIDAGHGGHDPGAPGVDGRRREKEVTLQIARAVRDELRKSGRVRVALTRDDDRFLILGERREIARRLKADLFISIHADSAPNPAARGATIYTLSEVASDRVAAQLAARENRADILNGVNLGGETNEVSSILLDLAQRETMNVSAAFAALLQREMSPTVPFRTEFHRFAGLVVLKAPDVPSVLLETGYMSNVEDEAKLFSRDYQQDIAVGVRRAVETHFARRLAKR